VTFSGAVNVFVTYPSGRSVNLNETGNVSALGTVSSGTWQGSTVGVAYGGTGVTASSGANSVVLRDANENITVNRLNQGLQNITASGGVTTLTAASDFNQLLTGTGNHTFRLPDATTLTDTTAFQFNNAATGTLTIQNNAGTTVGTVTTGGAANAVLISNATVGGTWEIHGYLPEGVTWGTNALDLGTTVISNGTWQGGTIQSGYGGTGLTTFAGANNALYSTSASALVAGTLPVAAGGTGLTSYTLNGVVYASATNTLTTGSALTFDGTNFNVVRAAATDQYMSLYADGTGPTLKFFGGAAGKIAGIVADAASASMYFTNDGDKPFVYAINGSEQMRLTSTGLGIGTSSPSGIFNIKTGNGQFLVQNGTSANQMRISAFNNAGNANAALIFEGYTSEYGRFDSSGNLGLGVTPSAWYTSFGTKAFQFAASGALFGLDPSSGDRRVGMLNNAFINSGGAYTYINTGAATQYQQTIGQHQWFNAASGTAGDPITFTQAMTLDASGNLLIGRTTGTGANLDVYESASNDATIRIGNVQNAAVTAIGKQGATSYGATTAGDSFLYSDGFLSIMADNASGVIKFSTGGNTEKMRLDSSGNLGLGVTPSAWASQPAIQQTGGAIWGINSANYELLQNAFYNGTNYIYCNTNLASRYNQNAGVHSWFTAPSGTAGNAITFTERMYLDSSGLGVYGAQASSAGRLSVSTSGGSSGNSAYFTHFDGSQNIYLQVQHSSDGIKLFNSSAGSSSNNLIFGNGTTSETMRISGPGNLSMAASGAITSSRINPRASSSASPATLTPDIQAADQYGVTALANALTINAPAGTPVDGNKLMFRILDNGTARAITWNATYTVIGTTLPTTTTANKTTYVGCVYNANNTRWDVVAVTTQA
jgi:hypothetical protein